ncbi:hypothetical protein ACFY7C_31090 [Streptomyces sp. NPDC012769]|uniref:hypothetical protein n=1 Tax=Streptomyces sp. NPDC012769 TaxID=3364848 RepID=UPI0036A7A733
MKQSAAKTLGVAALGAAFAAAAAGTASAAPASLPVGPDALGLVTNTLPLGEDLTELPSGTGEAVAGGQGALGTGVEEGVVKTLPGAVEQAQTLPGELQEQAQNLPLEGAKSGLDATPLGAAGGLLGGLPVGGLGGLPVGGLGL